MVRKPDIGRNQFRARPQDAHWMAERAAGPCQVRRDFHDKRFHQRQTHRAPFLIESVQHRLGDLLRPRMIPARCQQILAKGSAGMRRQGSGAAGNPQPPTNRKTKHRSRGLCAWADNRSAHDVHGPAVPHLKLPAHVQLGAPLQMSPSTPVPGGSSNQCMAVSLSVVSGDSDKGGDHTLASSSPSEAAGHAKAGFLRPGRRR
jgi:hypothetical protein